MRLNELVTKFWAQHTMLASLNNLFVCVLLCAVLLVDI